MTTARVAAAGLAAVALLGSAACSGSGEAGGIDVNLRLVAPDNNIRLEGAECAGARPFQYVHAGTPFALEGEDGEVLAEGELPAGRAENADPGVDWGVERIPTVCVLELSLTGVPERESYVLRLDGGPPLDFESSFLSEDEPLQLIVE